ncbi:unnamed protein product [Arabidopsis thaliana]|uniref:Transmembrane protein n=4 Tax=Arabidopsis TaxID=3701 RepID=A0A654FS03_ARATH|nr:uncharacterized protein AT4G23271 [Arabidopsis thaliana]KAG7617023.1 hypothetical protein ISN45_At04g024460 [Arabidopsis thaliana x Arabidopsis arenosa]KAG7621499.1 hypothetical protein ISN44_As04g023970 [Arabidopsis suecica]AEE84732.1 transmembrane protein [Arabidopsis thaliana]CAA0396228.1 unnamed protein product [Arabidopsis thaliana]VYS63642.1 unnamed protein product [Arabidopsis thaliana]|eukprot:NP_001119034.1 transmembrane protein [Arabidopsis thaliana]
MSSLRTTVKILNRPPVTFLAHIPCSVVVLLLML